MILVIQYDSYYMSQTIWLMPVLIELWPIIIKKSFIGLVKINWILTNQLQELWKRFSINQYRTKCLKFSVLQQFFTIYSLINETCDLRFSGLIFSSFGERHFYHFSPKKSKRKMAQVVSLVNKSVGDDKQFPFPASRHSAWIWSKIEINAKISSLLSSSANFVLNKRFKNILRPNFIPSWIYIIERFFSKVGCVFPMVFGRYRDGDHREDTPHFTKSQKKLYKL